MMKKNKTIRKMLISTMLVLVLSMVMVAIPQNSVEAADKCKEDANGNPVCPGDTSIKLQIGLPFVGKSCQYEIQTETGTTPKMLYCVKDFPTYVRDFYDLFMAIVGILAVIMIMVGGFQWLLAGGNAQKITGAKTTLISAIMGLVLALTTSTILGLVNTSLVNLEFSAGDTFKSAGAGEATAGFCTEDKAPLLGKDPLSGKDIQYPKCGVIYAMKEEGKSCRGNICSKGDNSCIGSADKYSCSKGPLKIDWPNEDGSFIYERANLLASYDVKLNTCGELYVVKKNKDINDKSNQFIFSWLCNELDHDPSTCFIDIAAGADFGDKEWAKVEVKKTKLQKIGQLNGAKCVSYK